MAKGIIYIMTTVVPGLIKIGKTGTANFESRMYTLERNGYSNVVGLRRYFAIEVDDYDEKEILLDDIFSKSRLENTELFALDVNLVVQLLSSFEGKQIYPKDSTKDEVFDDAAGKRDTALIPEGTYTMSRKMKDGFVASATMIKKNEQFILCKGCKLMEPGPNLTKGWTIARNAAKVSKEQVLLEDIECNSPSMASSIVLGSSSNGWVTWKNKDKKPIDIYRSKKEK